MIHRAILRVARWGRPKLYEETNGYDSESNCEGGEVGLGHNHTNKRAIIIHGAILRVARWG
jgi:hypothetical protein